MKAKLGPDHPDTLLSRENLASDYHGLGRHAEALKLHEETAAMVNLKLGPDHPLSLGIRTNLAEGYAAVGRHAESLKLHEETLPLLRAKLGPEHEVTLALMLNLACCEMTAGRTQSGAGAPGRGLCGQPEGSRVFLAGCRRPGMVRIRPGLRRLRAADLRVRPREGRRDHGAARREPRTAAFERPRGPRRGDSPAQRAVGMHDGQPERLALGMAEFRNGHLTLADDAVRAAAIGPDVTTAASAAFYRAMTLFKQGRKDEASKLAAHAAGAMKPLPRDDVGPMAGNNNPNNLILWLAYKEAKAMIGFAAPSAAPEKPNSQSATGHAGRVE